MICKITGFISTLLTIEILHALILYQYFVKDIVEDIVKIFAMLVDFEDLITEGPTIEIIFETLLIF